MSETTQNERRVGRPTGTTQEKSDLVARVRDALGMRQQDFAQELGCGISTVRRLESLNLLPTTPAVMEKLTALAKRAKVTL